MQGGSFADGSDILAEQAELSIGIKRLWRATKRLGEERLAEEEAAAEAYEKLPLPAQQKSPVDQVPQVACVQMDGGRLQIRDRHEKSEERDAPATHWGEFKVGTMISMQSEVHTVDPCPELPATFADPGKMREIAREIKGFTTAAEPAAPREKSPEQVASECGVPEQGVPEQGVPEQGVPEQGVPEQGVPEREGERPGKPVPLVRSVVALVGHVELFGRRLASAAYARGFHAALRKAFVSDGSETNWSVHRRWFSQYTPILDFIHALMYVYAAALAGRAVNEGWLIYRDWAQWLWSGQVDQIIAALTERQAELGLPADKETGTPRAQVAESLGYLTRQRSRMNYPEYRRQGLPITSSYIESTIKQINRRMKGTEKFWSTAVNAMLTLVADELTETNVIPNFWRRRTDRLASQHCYHLAT